jgi:hypothetical protein
MLLLHTGLEQNEGDKHTGSQIDWQPFLSETQVLDRDSWCFPLQRVQIHVYEYIRCIRENLGFPSRR